MVSSCNISEKVNMNNEIQDTYGFNYSTPYVQGREVIKFVDVDESGILWSHGVRSGDILVSNLSVNELHNVLRKPKGTYVKFRIQRLHKDEIKVIQIKFKIP
jgi:hypothetical protein